jgi:hypothetical protein
LVDERRSTPTSISDATASTFIILCCWNLWKHRNGVAFHGERPCPLRLLAMCRDDAMLWRVRVPAVCRDTADLWDAYLRDRC